MLTAEEYFLETGKAFAEALGREGVDKIANAIGGAFPFWGLKKEAVKTYVSEIKNSDLSPMEKLLAIGSTKKMIKQMENQMEIARIALKVASPNTDFSEKSEVDEDWLDRFMDSARFVSDEKVQLLWGNVLASEFEHPGSTPPSVVRILTEITPRYAKVFQNLCSLSIDMLAVSPDGAFFPLESYIILPSHYTYLSQYDINFSTLNELRFLGLIQFDSVAGYVLRLDKEKNLRFT